jgi:hypothetical protein
MGRKLKRSKHPAVNRTSVGSSPTLLAIEPCCHVAQPAEHLTVNQGVVGSTPTVAATLVPLAHLDQSVSLRS